MWPASLQLQTSDIRQSGTSCCVSHRPGSRQSRKSHCKRLDARSGLDLFVQYLNRRLRIRDPFWTKEERSASRPTAFWALVGWDSHGSRRQRFVVRSSGTMQVPDGKDAIRLLPRPLLWRSVMNGDRRERKCAERLSQNMVERKGKHRMGCTFTSPFVQLFILVYSIPLT